MARVNREDQRRVRAAMAERDRRILPVRLILPALHTQQSQFVEDQHRVVVAACGTKTGKTFGNAIWLTRHAWNNYQSLNWWCAPFYRQAKIAFELVQLFLPHDPRRVKVHKTDLAIELLRADGRRHSLIEFRSAENPDTLRGDGVHAAVADEGSFWRHASWVSLWTTLTRTRGHVRLISTPKGRNWFYDEYQKGLALNPDGTKKYPTHACYRLPTSSNPYVPRESIEEARQNMPEDVFKQEFLAEFLDESAGVFRNIGACQTAEWVENPVPGRQYVIGIDWAKHEDYTVFMIGDLATRKIVHIMKHNEIDWNVNIDRAVRTARKWNNAAILHDSTGEGDVIHDNLKAAYSNVEGYSIFNNAPKVALIQKAQLAFEKKEIAIPKRGSHPNADRLQRELEIYGYQLSPQGKFVFGAPEGEHDDFVIALAMCWWRMSLPTFRTIHRSIRGV
jgi:hypothetical protein